MLVIILLLNCLSVNSNVHQFSVVPPRKDWFQYAMTLKEWKKNGNDEPPHVCLKTLSLLNDAKPDGWKTFSSSQQSSTLSCMLKNTRLRSPSKLATNQLCNLALGAYNPYLWVFLPSSQQSDFVDCLTDRILNYELEDQYVSTTITFGDVRAIQWKKKTTN